MRRTKTLAMTYAMKMMLGNAFHLFSSKVVPVPVPVPLSVPVLFGSESTVLFGSSVLFGSYIVVGTSGIKPI